MEAKTHQQAGYDTDLSDAEWELLKPLIYPADARRGHGAGVIQTPRGLVWTPSVMF